jgi:tetratricopeptide (TPR) repeat protein
MKKTQILIILAGIVVVILLYKLPKTIVADSKEIAHNEADNQVDENHSEEEGSEEFINTHSGAGFKIDQERLDYYKKQFYSFSDQEKKLIFADSIASLFKKAGQYDSLAYYLAQKATLNADDKNLIDAGEAYFEAFSASGGKRLEYNTKAREYYQQALDKKPGNMGVKAKLAMTYVATENPMQGIVLLREILDKDPENEDALYSMGILSIQSGQNDKAVERFNHLLKVNPAHANGRFYLGLAYLNLGKNKRAKAEFEKARSLDKDPGFQSVVDSYLKEIK